MKADLMLKMKLHKIVDSPQMCRFRILNVVDDYSRELIRQLIATSISGWQVARFLDQLIVRRSQPSKIVCDNGPEFTSQSPNTYGVCGASRLK